MNLYNCISIEDSYVQCTYGEFELYCVKQMYYLIQHWIPFRLSNIRLLIDRQLPREFQGGIERWEIKRIAAAGSSWMFSNWLLADFRNRECPNSTSCFARLLRKKPWLYSQFRGNNEVISARPMVRGSRCDVRIDPRCCTVTGSVFFSLCRY